MRSGGHDHAQGPLNVEETLPSTDTSVPPKNPKVTFSDAAIPRRVPPTIDSILHVPDCPYSLDEIHFLLWYTLTTTLSPDKIAELFNNYFSPAQPIDRWAIADIVHVLETRWEASGKSFGRDFRLLHRPTAHGTCPCDFTDFHIDCVAVKRTTKTRQNEKYLRIAASLWDESAAELVLCPHGRRKAQRHHAVAQETPPSPPGFRLLALLQNTWNRLRHPGRTAATFTFWLSILHIFCTPASTLDSSIQRTLNLYLHTHPTPVLTVLHFLFEGTLDLVLHFSQIRATAVDELAWQALIRLWQLGWEITAALLLCSVLGVLPPAAMPTEPALYVCWTPACLFG
jgi:hypothetical protein